MTPPGDGLEFHRSSVYLARTQSAAEIDQVIQNELRNRPHSGVQVEGILRELNLVVGSTEYVVFFTREGNKVGLTALFEAFETIKIAARRQELKKLFKKGGIK